MTVSTPPDAEKTLSDLLTGQSATIVRLSGPHELRQRLMVMGVVGGESVKVVKVAPLGDPIELELGGYHLSLRRAEADGIIVELPDRATSNLGPDT